MGTSGNGDGFPDSDGPSGGPPELPAGLGPVIVPDDPAELAAEAESVRRELRRTSRRDGWRQRLGMAPKSGPSSSLRPTVLIMSIAVLATLASLFTAVWPGQPRQGGAPRTVPTGAPGEVLPALDLVGEEGQTVPLRSTLPAMIIFIDDCECSGHIDAAARAAPPGVTVIGLVSGGHEPSPLRRQPTIVAATVRSLADPTAELRGFLRLAPRPGAASAVLVRQSGEIVRTLPAVTSPEDYRVDLVGLTRD